MFELKKWLVSYIAINGSRTHLGVFEDEREAEEAYNKETIEHFGVYAKTNEFTD